MQKAITFRPRCKVQVTKNGGHSSTAQLRVSPTRGLQRRLCRIKLNETYNRALRTDQVYLVVKERGVVHAELTFLANKADMFAQWRGGGARGRSANERAARVCARLPPHIDPGYIKRRI